MKGFTIAKLLFVILPGFTSAFLPVSNIGILPKITRGVRVVFPASSLTEGAELSPEVGREFRVMGFEYNSGIFANLKVFAEPGNPYGEVLSLLRNGDFITAIGFKNFCGQTWVQHVVDESARGLYKGKAPREPYVGWSAQDVSGHRWLMPMDIKVTTEPMDIEVTTECTDFDSPVLETNDMRRGPAPGPVGLPNSRVIKKGRGNWKSHRPDWVNYNGLVWTVGFPRGAAEEDDIAEQTRLSLSVIDDRLTDAGTDKTRILEATVFLADINLKAKMDAVWQEWLPEGGGASRATVAVQLAEGQLVEIKVTAAAASSDL